VSDEENKTPDEIVDALIDIVSKNGNLLLNIGPKPDGTISPEQVNVLLGIGAWLKINGEAIYGTRPWVVAEEGPTVAAGGSFADQKPVVYTARDIRYTTKDSAVYAFCLDIPAEKKITMKALGLKANSSKKITKIELLGSQEKIKWTQQSDMLVISTPKEMPCREAICFKVSFQNK
jgi:alpha-L-fucosidase